MRIISGTYKGKRISAPKKLPVRPTTDRAKEGLFNILSHRYSLGESSVLDLFSGTGNISFEFASRGVTSITAVDAHAGCTQFIHKTARAMDLPIEVTKMDAFTFLERSRGTYDIIFADPPYHFKPEQFFAIPELVFKNDLLHQDGVLIVEHSPQTTMDTASNFSQKRAYGSSIFSFFEI